MLAVVSLGEFTVTLLHKSAKRSADMSVYFIGFNG